MKQKVLDRVKELLGSGKIQGFIGLRKAGGHVEPHLFMSPEELETLNLGDADGTGDARYPLTKLLLWLVRTYPDATFGILTRGCDERSLVELYKWKQVLPEKVVTVGIACTEGLARACACSKPYPDECVAGDKVEGIPENAEVRRIDALPIHERFQYWMSQFDKCLKCYGCRNICPMCFCNECSLEEPELVATGVLPTENPIFHLTRAVHMIGRCIDCGLCEEACPADIPLRTLYKKVAEIVEADTSYRPGMDREKKCPFNVFGPTPSA